VQEALNKARQMCETGFANVSIEDESAHQIDGDEFAGMHSRKKDDHRRFASSLGKYLISYAALLSFG
jgi:hypothetical protein